MSQYNARTDRWLACLPLLGVQAEAFLGTRGDVRDTRWDMFLALLGALAARLLLSGVHDRQLAQLLRDP